MPKLGRKATLPSRPTTVARLAVLGTSALAMGIALVVIPVTGGVAEEAKPVTPAVHDISLGSVEAPAPEVEVVVPDEASGTSGPVTSTSPSQAPAAESPAVSSAEPSASSTAESTATPSATEAPQSAETTQTPEPAEATETDGPAAEPGTQVLSLDKEDTQSFSMVGVSWTGADGEAVTAQIRVKDLESGEWTEWAELTVDPAAMGAGSDEIRSGTAPYWFGISSGVEVAVTIPDGSDVHDVKLTLIDPKKVAQDANAQQATPNATAGATAAMPPVYSRAQWGADESQSGWSPQYSGDLKAVTIHHSADGNNYSMDDVPGIMRSIYRYQAVTLGWGDIGYNVVVDKFGRAWEGRKGGLDSTVMGAHAGGFNTNTWGLSMLGNYDLVNVPAAVKEKLAQLIAWKFSMYGVNPLGTTTLTQQGGGGTTAKYKNGQAVSLNTIFGHRDTGSTVCPGQYGYAMLPSLRARVAQIMATLPPPTFTAYQRSSNSAGVAHKSFKVGSSGQHILSCDMDGDGSAGYAVVTNGVWRIYHKNAGGQNPSVLTFGGPGDIPVCGKWFGGPFDLLGIYRPSTATYYFRHSNSSGFAEWAVTLGNPHDKPIVGDWDGNGSDTIGVYRAAQASFFYANSNVPGSAAKQVIFGNPGDTPIVGKFSGNSTAIGVRRGVTYYLASSANGGTTSKFTYGDVNDKHVFGDWDGNGSETVSVIR